MVYAVRNGRQRGKFYDWVSCQRSVSGYSGAEYRKFSSDNEADKYLSGDNIVIPKQRFTGLTVVEDTHFETQFGDSRTMAHLRNTLRNSKLDEDTAVAFCDGSYSERTGKAGYGILYLTNKEQETLSGSVRDTADYLGMRNITGELLAAMFVTLRAYKTGIKKLILCYDYEGVEYFAKGWFGARGTLTKIYRSFMKLIMNRMIIHFVHTKGHTGSVGNEYADKLARAAAFSENAVNDIGVVGDNKTKGMLSYIVNTLSKYFSEDILAELQILMRYEKIAVVPYAKLDVSLQW